MTASEDDLGHPALLEAPPRRVVSLVPSLTEALARSRPDLLVGATVWCTHPADLDVERVRGTKNPHVGRIIELAPDLVVANREENRRRHVEALREAGVPVWVTDIRTVTGAFVSLRRLMAVCDLPVPPWLPEAERLWSAPPPEGPRVAVPIWRDPWMFVGGDTFAHDLLTRLGAVNVCAHREGRYPAVSPAEVLADGAGLAVLPDEPYAFGPGDGPEAFPGVPSVYVSGRDLTWYGPSLVPARTRLRAALRTP
ncbi:helical backbone metal receptor [Nocardiopsis kunsanensis]|uniref:ABC transporter substrate-binding protein n=1 Tax=Nocardiopsis kunsanensis TaxID=141693 RepID=A0A919CFD7_9ACTN|nr:helical backbone metal receptor [Nocardiopsis kunsanensis]GHD18213.1 ABC transporter substrate-binding protein [Nocardiopsis kunsanensis]